MGSQHRGVAAPRGSEADELALASQWQLMWRRFRRHKLAVVAAIIVIMFYMVVLGVEFLSTNDPRDSASSRLLMPPQPLRLFDGWRFSPHVCAVEGSRDPVTFKKSYKRDCGSKIAVRLFARGFEYKFLGLIRTDRHLLGVSDPNKKGQAHVFLLGTDAQGRDLYARIIYGSRISLSIGLFGVALSLTLGIALGAISGYVGGFADIVIQRIIEMIRSIPSIPLWMGLAAAMPPNWTILQMYFAISVIVSLLAWTDLARVVRGRFLSLREEDFVTAAMLAGASPQRIMYRHMLPSLYSHIIASATLSIPHMIVAETSLSFLGLGLRPPAISWGVLLQATQNIQSIALTPWLMVPAIPVIVAILALNFMGDGLRDAADPYGM